MASSTPPPSLPKDIEKQKIAAPEIVEDNFVMPVPKEEWRIEVDSSDGDNRYHFKRYIKGVIHENYATVGRSMAMVYAASIINGFDPPKLLVTAERPK